MLRSYRDQAIVLRTYKLGEADRIVVLLGSDTGQIRAVAKGVRRTTSKFGARLDPFNLVDVQLHRGRNLDTVMQADLATGYASALGADYEAFTGAKVVVEAVQKLTDGVSEADPAYFPLLHGALASLATRRHPVELITASFLLRIMRESGWEPTLGICGVCGRTGDHRSFSPQAGGTVCDDCVPPAAVELSADALAQLGALLRGDWEAAQALPRSSWDEVARVAGTWTQWHLEQRLKSLPFLMGSR